MSQTKVTKEDVSTAISALKKDGKSISLAAIRAVLGNRGSLSTIQGLKLEIDAAEAALKDPPKALLAFRQIWNEAVQLGRSQRDVEVTDLEELNRALGSDLKVMEGEVVSSRNSNAGLQTRLEESVAKLAKANEALAQARLETNGYASQLVKSLEKHQSELANEKALLSEAQSAARALELRLARTETELALLKAVKARNGRSESKT